MAIWSMSILLLSLSLLLYRHPPATWTVLPLWLRPGKRRIDGDKQDTPAPNGHVPEPSVRLETFQEYPAQPCSDREKADSTNMEEDADHGGETPKASITGPAIHVPAFHLDDGECHAKDEPEVPDSPRPVLLPPNRVERASAMPPPPQPNPPHPKPNAASQLMPPPPRTPAAQLRATGLSSLRAPPPHQRAKVSLTPGHSPLDWALRSANLASASPLTRVTPSALASHTGRRGKPAWSAYRGRVYDITPYLPFHPGGEGELLRAAGREGAGLFGEVHAWVNWEGMLGSCLVGVLVEESAARGLDDMD